MTNADIPDAEYSGPIAGRYTTAEHLEAQQDQTDPVTGKPLHDIDASPAEVPTTLDTAEDPEARTGDDAGEGAEQGQHAEPE